MKHIRDHTHPSIPTTVARNQKICFQKCVMIHIDIFQTNNSFPLPSVSYVLKLLWTRRLMWCSGFLPLSRSIIIIVVVVATKTSSELVENICCRVDQRSGPQLTLLWIVHWMVSLFEDLLIQNCYVAECSREQAQ